MVFLLLGVLFTFLGGLVVVFFGCVVVGGWGGLVGWPDNFVLTLFSPLSWASLFWVDNVVVFASRLFLNIAKSSPSSSFFTLGLAPGKAGQPYLLVILLWVRVSFVLISSKLFSGRGEGPPWNCFLELVAEIVT